MHPAPVPLARISQVVLLLLILAALASAQENNVRPLILQPVDDSQRTTLKGNTHPLARAQFDRGSAPPDLPMQRMLLVLKRSDEQESALRKLLDDQQDKASPNYHKWLTPEQFGRQFGPADQDIQAVTSWLQMHGFQVGQVTKGRTVIEFSGTAAQVQEALHTSIHKFLVNGEEHWANASDPQIPIAMAPVVAGVNTLHNFYKKPMNRFAGIFARPEGGSGLRRIDSANPQFTFWDNCPTSDGTCYALAPYDFATIYNVLPLWNAGTDGSGENIAIVGRSNIKLQDVRDFRSLFGLSPKDPQVTLDGPDPGIPNAYEEAEADIDVQWSGAVAKNANINLVVSESTETTDGVDLSAVYIVNNNLAPVMSESFGLCELGFGTAGNQFFKQLWEQAAAQGITVFISSGDNGSAGCDFGAGPAQFGLAVNGIASTPFNVAVGGTDFNDLSNPLTYWNLSNDPATGASAKGYIPETTWNFTCTNSIFLANFGFGTNAETNCNNPQIGGVQTVGGSGGASNCTVNSQQLGTCSGGYPKPAWQTGAGVPNDGKRDLPDVSLFAGNGLMGNFYLVCEADITGVSCNVHPAGFGGTSVSSPAFAGIMALVNQKTQARQGNANYVFYKLAGQQSPASCNSSNGPTGTCVFNDVTAGTIAMPCLKGSPNCNTSNAAHQYGVLSGYSTTIAYDLATGLGSVNVTNLVNNWNSITFTPTTTSLTLSPTSGLTHGSSVSVNVSVAHATGSGTPSGDVSLITSTGTSLDGFTLSSGSVAASTSLLPGGSYAVKAHYAGDATFGGSDSNTVSVTIGKENSQTAARIITFDPNTGRISSSNASSAVYGSPYLLRVDVSNATGTSCLANPVACPSGQVSLTDNSTALDGGTFVLNSYGYTEDQLIQLPGGAHSVQAQYSGDNSFTASSATDAVTITPAPTTMTAVSAPSTVLVGQTFQLFTTIQTQSSGVAPTGIVTFSANGTPLSGTTSSNPINGSAIGPASLQVFFSTSLSSSGSKTITASYSGDPNYSSSSAAGGTVQAFNQTSLSLSVSSSAPQAGASVTLTALVDTAVKNLVPSGKVMFTDAIFGTLPGSVILTPTTDANGNSELKATLTFIPPLSTMTITAYYGGDSNFAQSSSNSIFLKVSGNDFAVFVSPEFAYVPQGQPTFVVVTIDGQSNYSGTVSFAPSSCSGLPRESSCAFGISSLTGSGTVGLTVSTTAPHALSAKRRIDSRWWTATFGLTFACVFLASMRSKRGRCGICRSVLMIFLLGTITGCGGGGGGGGGAGDPGTPRGSYTVTVTATSGALTHTASFKLNVQ